MKKLQTICRQNKWLDEMVHMYAENVSKSETVKKSLHTKSRKNLK